MRMRRVWETRPTTDTTPGIRRTAAYDGAGNLKTYSDGTTSASYTYDELYRKTQETVNYGSFSLTTSYSYNKNGTKKSFTYPNGTTINYTYDATNQIAGVNVPYAGNISFDAYQWTRPTNVTLPSASGAKQFAYDELMRTKTITSNDPSNSALMNYQYTYDKMDNIKTRNTQTGNYAYNYDNLYRLNEVKKDDAQTEGYTYDQVGNRLTSAATTGDWTYNSNNELLSSPLSSSGSTGGSSYVYDANGNTIQRTINGQVQNFVYDVDNRLIEVRDASNNLIAAYTYDPFGRRIKKTVSPSGEGQGEEVYYLYSDEGLIGEYDNAGSQLRIYGYKPDSTWSTDPLFMREGGNIYFYHNDHLGTPQKMTDISGNVVWSATYDAFGKATVDASSTITSNLRFPGQYFDAETGLHYNWHWYYEPNTGRYVTEDPIGLGGEDINLYRYVYNNPGNWIDMSGLISTNKPEPAIMTPWKGTKIPDGDARKALTCMESCLGFGVTDILSINMGGGLEISGGSECTVDNRHTLKSDRGSKHCTNQAFDISKSKIRRLGIKKVNCCAKQCGVKYILDEGTWYHYQTVPGLNKSSGSLPSNRECPNCILSR